MTPEERSRLANEVARQHAWYDRGSRLWSTVHHTSLFLSAVLSAAAALVLKLESASDLAARNDWGAGLAAAAALTGTLAAAGGFSRKWQANRLSRGRIEQLRIDLDAENADSALLRAELKRVIAEHDRSLLGQGP